MKKKIIILALGVAIIFSIIVAIYMYEMSISNKIYDRNLSNRSKTFINDHLKESIREGARAITPTQLSENDCFSITIPFLIKSSRKDGPCDWHYAIASPKMNIIVYQRPTSITNLDDETGVRLRRTQKNTYRESQLSINERSYIAFHKIGGAYETNVFTLRENALFVINIIGYTSENLDEELRQLLSSIKFL